jgi:hypothetical protein
LERRLESKIEDSVYEKIKKIIEKWGESSWWQLKIMQLM